MLNHSLPLEDMKTVAILVFDDVEELDFVGPLEVFGTTGRLHPGTFRAVTFSSNGATIKGRYGLTVTPDHSFENLPDYDILLVPGGRGALKALEDPATIAFVKDAVTKRELLASVCTGALVLAAAGLLNGKKATTHWASIDELGKYPGVTVIRDKRYVHDGKIVTSAGISAGIDMALYLLHHYFGPQVSSEVAHRIEYQANIANLQNPSR